MVKKDRLPIDQLDGTALVPLHNGNFAVIDSIDIANVSLFTWHQITEVDGQFYAATNFMRGNGSKTIVRMHRLILNFPLMLVDHIDHQGINNRRSNLRLCNDHLNQGNSIKRKPGMYSKYKGVSLHKSSGLFRVQLMIHRKVVFWSYHKNDIDAARSYDAAALKYFGEFSATNESLGLLQSVAS